ncbi:hypothetical protein RYJ27_05510 [Microbacterium limosum]|uniref:MarR family transcriptional regulator n=1 Tax=Microbacterium limosum TaxID=3079935 RepID=A0AAU0MLM2_9MICO|nr:hypothetical protein [Microbacterium sp. Y20]WOQ70653.1 hypothetical protein RYJ27_05510 [Microbacterium sp. Y20]
MNTHEEHHGEATAGSDRPLGYWLRLVDALISREFDTRLAEPGADRRDWMLLNIIDGTHAWARAPRGKRMRRLEDRGWIEQNGSGDWTLTDAGREMKARLAEAVSGIRERVSGAVSPEDYATTIATLQAMARELGGDQKDDLYSGLGFGRFGRGRHGRPFGPGFGPGFRPGFGRAFGPGFRPGFGPAFDADDDARHCDDGRDHGSHRNGHRHGKHRHGKHRHGEHAYERGFDAGFARGRESAAS